MSKPQNKKQAALRFKITTAFTGIFLFYLFLHIPKGWDGTPESIEYIVNHMLTSPFDIFPIEGDYLVAGFVVSMVSMLLMYQHFLNRRNLRPDEEHGSAKWNFDLRKFYLQYADGKLKYKLPIPRPKGKGFFSKLLKDLINSIEKLFLGWSYELNVDTGGNKTWTYTEDEEGRQIYKHDGTKNMILSQDVVLSMNTRQTFRNNNILVMGGSGTGKSRFMIKPNMLQANCSFVITDPSGELLESMGSFLKEKGYEIRVFNLVQMDHSHCYNPFHYIRNEEGVLTMINALIKNTTPKGSSTNDPFWEKAETALLQAICFYLMAECNPDDQNFNSVMKLLRCVDAGEGSEDQDSVLDVLMNDLREKDPEHIALQSYAVFKSAGGGKTAQSILISCQTRLQVFNLSVIKNLTNTDNIDLKSVGDKPTALFCITPVVDTTFNFLVALLYTQLFDALYFHAETECNDIYHQGLRLPVHVRFLLDEFANIGTIPEFSQKLATMRKYEISCTIVIQALSQLKAMYKDDWEVLVGNCDTQVFLGGTDATTLEYISKKLGKETIRAKNSSRSYGRQGSSSESYNQTGRELLQMDEISRMDNNNCLVFIRGVLPFFTTKYAYDKHPNYPMTGDADSKLLYDIKKTVHTAAPVSTAVQIAAEKRRDIHRQVEVTDDTVVRTVYEQRAFYSRKEEETARRNRAIELQEAKVRKDMNLSGEYIEDVVKQNHFTVSAESIQEKIMERYPIDEVAQIVNSEFDSDEDMGSSLDEPFVNNEVIFEDEENGTDVSQEFFMETSYEEDTGLNADAVFGYMGLVDDLSDYEDEGKVSMDSSSTFDFKEITEDSLLDNEFYLDSVDVLNEDVFLEWDKNSSSVSDYISVGEDTNKFVLVKICSNPFPSIEEMKGYNGIYVDSDGVKTEIVLSENELKYDKSGVNICFGDGVFSFAQDTILYGTNFSKGIYIFSEEYVYLKIYKTNE